MLRDWNSKALLFQSGFHEKVTIVRGALSNVNKLERILAEYGIQFVFHLAAQTVVTIANKNPLSTLESNIAGTWNL
ncbi:MAG: GDP-mannose 4,6-dehydratase [Rickettsia endosymbiont of Ixodes persulcatus]|nr:GDP-mannose 4,6-dehydratase [Rickettsia endosymbiont of Ixodes persulcatus]